MSADKSSRKRRRTSESHSPVSSEVEAEAPAERMIKVNHHKNEDQWTPILASTSGTGIPNKVPFNVYRRKHAQQQPSNLSRGSSSNTSSELLVQSSAHPKLDFVGREGENEADSNRKHFLAVFDPDTNEVNVIDVPKVVIHQNLREAAPDKEKKSSHMTSREQRAALIEDFGTKKARKAAREATENAILSNAPDGEPDATAEAVLSSMKDDPNHVSRDEVQEIAQAAKPIPKHNPDASHPSEFYPLETLVPNGLSTLHQLPIKEWQKAVNDGKAINTNSRYVSGRVEAIVRSGDTTHLQILRLILALVGLVNSLKRAPGRPPSSRKLPPESELRRVLSGEVGGDDNDASSATTASIPESVISAIRRSFAPQGPMLSKKDIMLIHTTICALTLHIPPISGGKIYSNSQDELATFPEDIRSDLQVNQETVRLYFRELGCKSNSPLESEYAKFGVVKGKQQATRMRVMRLRLPVVFPKLKQGRRIA